MQWRKWWAKIARWYGWDTKAPPRHLHCSNCGERLQQAHYCRACGASEESGWAEPDHGLDGEDDFDYDDFVKREFGTGPGKPENVAATTWGTLLIILVVLGLLLAQFGGYLL